MSISVDDMGRIEPLKNGVPFVPDVATDLAAPQMLGKDRRAHVQILSQFGMTHGTDRHQRPPLMTAGRAIRQSSTGRRNVGASAWKVPVRTRRPANVTTGRSGMLVLQKERLSCQ